MNWTGGKLQQHSKQDKNSTLYRQEQHFARVRQQLQDPPQSRQPFRPSFLNSDEMSPVKQSRLDDFSNTGPLAHRLSSMSSRHNEQGTKRRAEHRDADLTKMLPKRKRQEPPDKRGTSSKQPPREQTQANAKVASEADEIEAARRRLLMQSDWLGLQPSKPLRMKFTSTQEREQFGRRHKIEKRPQQEPDAGHRMRVPSIRGDLVPRNRWYEDDEEATMGSLKIKIGEGALSSTYPGSKTRAASNTMTTARPENTSSSPDGDAAGEQEVGDFPATQNMLDDTSFHGFCERSSRAHGGFSRPDTGFEENMLDEEHDEEADMIAQAGKEAIQRTRLVFPSSNPATPPALDAQSNVASPSLAPPASKSLVEEPVDPAQNHQDDVSPSQERLWRSFAGIKAEATTTQASTVNAHTSKATGPVLTRPNKKGHPPATKDDPQMISSDSDSSIPSSPPRPNETEPSRPPPAPPSVQPTASPPSTYRRLTTIAAAPKATLLQASKSPPPPAGPKHNPMHSDPDAMWKAFVFGDISPARASTSESIPRTQPGTAHDLPQNHSKPKDMNEADSSLQARGSWSAVTDVPSDSSILERDPELAAQEAADARTDVATQLASARSSPAITPPPRRFEGSVLAKKPNLAPKRADE